MKRLFTIFLILVTFAFSVLCFADDASVAPAGADIVGGVLGFVMAIPKVGPLLAKVMDIIAAIGSVMTVLVVAAQAVLGIPEIAARWMGASAIADKIKGFSDKVMPWLKWLSIFNASKKQPAQPPQV